MESKFKKVEDAAPRFKAFCDNFQSIGIALGVLVGGIWAAYTFWSLKSVENANLEYLRKKERWPAINAEVATEIIDAEVDNYSDPRLEARKQIFINVTVTLKNVGNFPTILDYSKPSLHVARLNINPQGAPALAGPRAFSVLGAEGKTTQLLMAPSGETKLQYMVNVLYSGVHVVEFRLPYDPKSATGLIFGTSAEELRVAAAIAKGAPREFSTSVYAYVPSERLRPTVATALTPGGTGTGKK